MFTFDAFSVCYSVSQSVGHDRNFFFAFCLTTPEYSFARKIYSYCFSWFLEHQLKIEVLMLNVVFINYIIIFVTFFRVCSLFWLVIWLSDCQCIFLFVWFLFCLFVSFLICQLPTLLSVLWTVCPLLLKGKNKSKSFYTEDR